MRKAKRVEYIDAMRGFTMFFVVVGHVLDFSFLEEYAFVTSIMKTFRMPLFFFISGYVGYKNADSFGLRSYTSAIWKKLSMAMLPCCIFYFLYTLLIKQVRAGWILGGMMHMHFGGYWFVPELFKMFMIYYTLMLLSNIGRFTKYLPGILVIIAVIRMLLGVNKLAMHLPHIFFFSDLSGYIVFFILGILVRERFDFFKRLLDNELLNGIMLVLWMSCGILYYKYYGLNYGMFYLSRLSGLFVSFSFFYHCRDFFSRNGRLSRLLQFIGRRTLEIYLLHYFFIPEFPQIVVDWFVDCNNGFLLMLSSSIFFAVLIVAMCLGIGILIRRNSPILAHYLLGARIVK